MTIEIDLELLKTTNLSPNEFIGLYLVFRKGYTYLEELNLNIDWTNLERKGYVKNELVTDKFKSLFSNNFDLHNKSQINQKRIMDDSDIKIAIKGDSSNTLLSTINTSALQ